MNLLVLSKEDLKLAKAEIQAITKILTTDNNLILTNSSKYLNRLAYTKSYHKLLFISNRKQLIDDIKKFNWNLNIKKDFSVRTINSKIPDSKLANLIWNKLRKPKVNLVNAKSPIVFIFGKNIYATMLSKSLIHRFNLRKAHNRSISQPSSLHPKLARAMINLTGIKRGTILDPFCGTGGILIEAGLMGFKTLGYDINPWMINACEKNLKQYKIKNYILKIKDATKIKNKNAYIVTDLPYAKNTKSQNLDELYIAFLSNLKKLNPKGCVMGFPNSINYKKILAQTKFKIMQEFTHYLHKSLSKKIVVLNQIK